LSTHITRVSNPHLWTARVSHNGWLALDVHAPLPVMLAALTRCLESLSAELGDLVEIKVVPN
jgi:hypothetical protein